MNQIILQSMKEVLKEKYKTIVNAPKDLVTSAREIYRLNKELNSTEADDKLYYLTLSLINQKDLTDEQIDHKAELIKKYGYKELHEYTIKKSAELNI